MITINVSDLLLAFIAALGIPSTIMGLLTWRLKKRIEAAEEEQSQKNNGQKELIMILVQSTRASIALGEATARAVQRVFRTHIATGICTPPSSMPQTSNTAKRTF